MWAKPAAEYGCSVDVSDLLRRHGFVMLAVGAAAGLAVEFVVRAPGGSVALVPLGLALPLPLLARRRFPLAAPIAVTAAFAAATFPFAEELRESSSGLLATALAAWAVGAGNSRQRALAGLAALMAIMQVAAYNLGLHTAGDAIFPIFLIGIPWVLGYALHRRDERARELGARAAALEREGEARAAEAAAEERRRIARELHDVVAHSISVMTIQAGAARLLAGEDADRAEEALRTVEETGHTTLAEMRRLTGVLGPEDAGLASRPSLDNLDALVNQVTAAGLPVEVHIDGARRPLAPGIDLAAYRIVQESLTNVLKHAGRARARLSLSFERDALELEIADDGAGAGKTGATTGGHGLVGMRERVLLYGGAFAAGPRGDGGYLVHARLPLVQGER
jgi:signal transduction histidine kinase